jgi:hypothetical protein
MDKTIGFVVEGNIDKMVVEALTPRVTGGAYRAQIVRIGGPIAVRWAYSTVLMLLEEKRCPHVVLLLDSDSAFPSQIERRRREVEAMLEEHRLGSDEVSVCLAVPQIEAWLLAAYEESPEEHENPKLALFKHLDAKARTPEGLAEVARSLDIEVASKRSPSFDQFVRILRRIAERLAQAPAA